MRELCHTEDNQHHPKPAQLVFVPNLLASSADNLQEIHLHKFQRPSVPSSWVCTLVTIQTEANLENQQHRNKDFYLHKKHLIVSSTGWTMILEIHQTLESSVLYAFAPQPRSQTVQLSYEPSVSMVVANVLFIYCIQYQKILNSSDPVIDQGPKGNQILLLKHIAIK